MPKTYTEQPAQTNSSNESHNSDSFPYITFGLPLALVVIVTLLKNRIRLKMEEKERGRIILELCIDALTIGGTILIANYKYIEKPYNIFWNGFIMALILVYVIIVKKSYIDGQLSIDDHKKWIASCCILCFLILVYLFIIIC